MMTTTQPFLPALKKFAPAALKPICFFDFMDALEKKGWAYHDNGVTADRHYMAYKVDKHSRPACEWDELKVYLLEKFGSDGRVAFGITRPQDAPEQQTCTVLIAQSKLLKVLNQKRKEPAWPA